MQFHSTVEGYSPALCCLLSLKWDSYSITCRTHANTHTHTLSGYVFISHLHLFYHFAYFLWLAFRALSLYIYTYLLPDCLLSCRYCSRIHFDFIWGGVYYPSALTRLHQWWSDEEAEHLSLCHQHVYPFIQKSHYEVVCCYILDFCQV